MKRKDFLYLSGMGVGAAMLSNIPVIGSPVHIEDALAPSETAKKKQMADVALNTAKSKGASYADVRIGRYLNQSVITREDRVQNIANTESYGMGIRVLANGCWGFAATDRMDNDSIARAADLAVRIAKDNAKLLTEPVQLAPQKGYGEVSWKTPIVTNAFEVPVKDKVALLLEANNAAMKAGASFINNSLFMINEQKYFASTEGSYIDQDIHRIWPNFTITKTDKTTGRFETRNSLAAPMGMGYEYLMPDSSTVLNGIFSLFTTRYNMVEDARIATAQLDEKLKAKPVEPGKYDLILDPTNLFLTIHESVGHPTELDRVLGYEANFAGTSFLTLDKWKSGNFNFGSKIVNFVGDKTQPGALGTVGYDDEGVKCGKWDIIKDGTLVNYQTIRDQAHILGLNASQGCCYADDWSSVQFQRMPNVSLQPGKNKLTPAEMIKNTEKGLYMFGRNSYSIDQQRYNFQFSSQLCYEIRNGQIAGMVSGAAYQANTQEFWNSCSAICDERDYRLGGSFFDGKGQPQQVSAVSHGCATTKFDKVNIINTARKI
ncbi:TldD/PmbA family protein [Mucilaginibacter sp. RS28]|uniref:TldD/PmbA family protein n=1 Tax=Mucilaginibacter straminoryzae TaxID=2932774 RepID=A0A9X1X1H5_9SPHI|nr:TldD/PmbA family protein [Mucilaginibacter straminoryzae]MCJ8209457.1 TldD/PmbA family protein [Mucilaginibacter straminoryzae]